MIIMMPRILTEFFLFMGVLRLIVTCKIVLLLMVLLLLVMELPHCMLLMGPQD